MSSLKRDVQEILRLGMEVCQVLIMMTALRRSKGLLRYVARGRFVGEIPSKQIRAGASKGIVSDPG